MGASGTQDTLMVIGASGLLGRALVKKLSGSHDIAAPSEEELDITNREDVHALCRVRAPSVVILTAAYSDVDGCEDDPQRAYLVNVEGVRNVVEAVAELKSKLIFISSDHVFSGTATRPYTENDTPDPVNVYGRSKLQAESIIRSNLTQYLIVRSSWFFGDAQKGFVQAVIAAVREKKRLNIVSDKTGLATFVVDLASAIEALVGRIGRGEYDFARYPIVHIANSGICSWFDMADFVRRYMKADSTFSPIPLRAYPFKARRPLHSALDTSRYQEITGQALRPWQEALEEFLACHTG